jgi:predicted RNase H-like nuclease
VAHAVRTSDLHEPKRPPHRDKAFALKKTRQGKLERLALLVPCFPDIEKNLQVNPRALWGDILDAYACLWTAKRIATNQSKSFPQDSEQDGMGLIMEIVT